MARLIVETKTNEYEKKICPCISNVFKLVPLCEEAFRPIFNFREF